jgi:hypothetical protein
MSDRGQGRKPNPPELKTRSFSVRLTEARIEKLKLLGTPWLNKAIDRAKEPSASSRIAGQPDRAKEKP